MSWICSYAITMGTVTEEIMSKSDGVVAVEGKLQLCVAFFWLGRQQCGIITEENKVYELKRQTNG